MKSISQNVVIFLINLAIFLSILLLFFSYNLHYFYLHGAPVYDSGWCAWLSRFAAGWLMPNPPLIGGFALPIHFWLIYFLAHGVAAFLPDMPYPVWNSLFMALWPALLWLVSLSSVLRSRPLAGSARRVCRAFDFERLDPVDARISSRREFHPALFLASIACWLAGRRKGIKRLRSWPSPSCCRSAKMQGSMLAWHWPPWLRLRSGPKMALARCLVFLAAVGFCYSAGVLALQKFSCPGRTDDGHRLSRPSFSGACRWPAACAPFDLLGRGALLYLRSIGHFSRGGFYWRDRVGARGCSLFALAWIVSDRRFTHRRRLIWILFRAADVWLFLAVAAGTTAGRRARRAAD